MNTMEFDQQEQELLLEINPTSWYGEEYYFDLKIQYPNIIKDLINSGLEFEIL